MEFVNYFSCRPTSWDISPVRWSTPWSGAHRWAEIGCCQAMEGDGFLESLFGVEEEVAQVPAQLALRSIHEARRLGRQEIWTGRSR